jgi:signal transduction histidine kinase
MNTADRNDSFIEPERDAAKDAPRDSLGDAQRDAPRGKGRDTDRTVDREIDRDDVSGGVNPAPAAGEEPSHPAAIRRANILVVDDRDANLIAMEAVLEPLDVRVVRASSADEALRAVLVDDFAVILLDVEMPGTDGYEVAKLIKQRESARTTPIIFVTALSSDRRLVTSGYESGAVDYLFKPVDADLLRHKVSAFVELYQKREEEAWRQRRRYADLMENAARENEQRLRAAFEAEHEARRAAELAQARAEAAQAAAEEANRAKSNFLAIMSHELRTPLNAFQGYVQLLDMGLAGPVTDQQRSYFSRLDVSARHLLTLIDDVLDVAKVDAGRLAVARERSMTGDVVAAALSLTAPQAAARGVRLFGSGNGTAEGGIPFIGDEARVRQILVNLIGNAVKFTDAGGTVTVTCDVAMEPDAAARLEIPGRWAVIRVADTGIGIASNDMAAIFQPFHQIESGHTRTRGGTGLGLSISRRLARLMEGDLTVASTPGEGSVFSLWLPAASEAGVNASTQPAAAPAAARRVSIPGVRHLSLLGEVLRSNIERTVAAYRDCLRTDPLIPRAAAMPVSLLEDHAVSLIADCAQSLVIVGEAGHEATDLLRDGSAIQRTIAEHHGRRRHAQGWAEAALRRDHALLKECMTAVVRREDPGFDGTEALSVLSGMLDRVAEISERAWREAEMRGDTE